MKRMISVILVLAFLMTVGTAFAATAGAGKVKATDGSTNVRSGPGLKYSVMTSLDRGKSLDYANDQRWDERGVVWYKVFLKDNRVGWVSGRYTTLLEGAGSGDDPGEYTYDYGYTTGQTFIRKGPGMDYGTKTSIPKGRDFVYLDEWDTDERGVNWYYVSYNGTRGWISSRYAVLY